MKDYQTRFNQSIYALFGLALTISLALPSLASAAAVTSPLDLATIPLANSPTIKIQPNLLFVLDDSGSMDWNYLPDWANDNVCKATSGSYNAACNQTSNLSTSPAYPNQPPFRSSDFNAIYYNPAIVYTPAVNASGKKINTSGDDKGNQTTWTSVKNDAYNIQSTSPTNLVTDYTDVEWCTSTTYTDCLRNDNYILPGIVNGKSYTKSHSSVKSTGSGSVATGSVSSPTTAARSWGPHYYTIVPGEYCDSLKLTNCQTTATDTFKYPAKVRWCSTPNLITCQAQRTNSFIYPRYPTLKSSNFTTITITGSSSTSFSSIKVNNLQILSGSTSGSNNSTNVAGRIVTNINNCTGSTTGSCGIAGYSASSVGNVVTIFAPASLPTITYTPVIVKSGSMTVTTAAFSGNGGVITPGSFKRTDIVTGATYPKVGTRSDCTGAIGLSGCSYAEEMTNFANWWTYYQTRMQTMKTSASLAFKDIGTDFRVGFMTIHPTSTTSLKFDTFNSTQKTAWYTNFFKINPSSATPLRSVLARAGRIYAAKETVGGAFTDPMEYACQQNFTLLTTDGMWNTDADTDVKKVDGTNMTNQDASPVKSPYYEGALSSEASLADVAKYYHDTDLRTSVLGNCGGANNLPGDGVCKDPAPSTTNQRQNMVTLTLGLGVDGELAYSTNYKNQTTKTGGDFAEIKNGTRNWPKPLENEMSTIDDLWHAAVNGEGTYFSAKSPAELTSQLKEALASIKVKVGAGAAAATSTLNPVAGDNYAYVASYTSGNWTGNLEKREIDFTTGAVNVAATACVEDVVPAAGCDSTTSSVVANGTGGYDCVTPGSTAATCSYSLVGTDCKMPLAVTCSGNLKHKLYSDRKIKMKSGSSLVDFNYSNVQAAGLDATFKRTFLQDNLTQWASLAASRSDAQLDTDVAGTNLVNYLRGDTTYEESATLPENKLYRKRQAILGDAVNSKPAFIAKPTFSYSDTGYIDTFKEGAQKNRKGMVYMGTNDGMMHAFDANTLEELWAYVPTMVIRNMWKLANTAYSGNHAYFADGDPVISDIYDGAWKTILVAKV